MKIESVRIENFRSFKDETILFDDYTCFVGANGSGKSTVLNALNVFFRQLKDSKTDLTKLSKDDFHHSNISEPIKITVTFIDLSAEAKKDLADYVRQDKLIVSSVAAYDASCDCAEVKQMGSRLGFEEFRRYFEADKNGGKVDELKTIYGELKAKYTDLPNAATKALMAESLKEYESSHSEGCTLIPSEDQFYGVSKGVNKLAPHIQWVFVSASKDITEECEESKNSALGQLLARTVRSKINFTEKIDTLRQRFQTDYQNILDAEQGSLNDISTSLKERLESWSHPGISARVLWKQDSEKSVKVEEPWAYIKVGERGFEGELHRFGLGLQRSYMLALLQELTTLPDESAPTLIMAIEEPEIYQHPPQARYLAETLHDLATKKSQIITCSHSPIFIPGDDFESVRVVREKNTPSTSYISQIKYSDLAKELENVGEKAIKEEGMLAKLYPSLNPVINEMFFCKILVLVEGIEDVAYISTYLMLNNDLPNFRKYGCHIIPVGGKSNLIKPIAMANLLNIPVFAVFDADMDEQDPDKVAMHKSDNEKIQKLLGIKDVNGSPTETIFGENFLIWKTCITEEMINELGTVWTEKKSESEVYYGQPGGLNKNPLAIARALQLSWDAGTKSESLLKLTKSIIDFAEHS